MKVDPFAPQLLIDYTYFCDRFGPLPFDDFVAMWRAAGALMEAATGAGFEPHEVPDLLIAADNPRMAFIHATVACIRPNIGRMLPRRACMALARGRRGNAHRRRSTLEARRRFSSLRGAVDAALPIDSIASASVRSRAAPYANSMR